METTTDVVKEISSPAERMYQNHLKNVAKYQRCNPVKLREKQSRYLAKLKSDPTRHEQFLQKRRDYYKNVLKPRTSKERTECEAH